MDRRKSIKTIVLGSLLPTIKVNAWPGQVLEHLLLEKPTRHRSDWHEWHDMDWIGPEYWGNRLQDWAITDGRAQCLVSEPNRNLQILTIQKGDTLTAFNISVTVRLLNNDIEPTTASCIGFRLEVQGPFEDYRSAAVFGNGLDIGLSLDGRLVMNNEEIAPAIINIPTEVTLEVKAYPKNGEYVLKVTVLDPETNKVLSEKDNISIEASHLKGNFALLAHCEKITGFENTPLADFSKWQINGENLLQYENQIFGPICFAQYTLQAKKLKLTAQLAPFEKIKGHEVVLEIKKDGQWYPISKKKIENDGRAINFSVDNWHYTENIPYKITAKIPLKNEIRHYIYDGTISAEPIDQESIKLAVFSCNFHYGFPDADIHRNVSRLNPDVVLFLGDQFYEGTGGFGVQYKPHDKACLDYLRKWLMFGWSYRELFRHLPCAIIPDDHDVYHGNVWGESGKEADTSKGYGAHSQDSGGYKMPVEWVNMVQFTQTSHLPDPYDPTPVKQGIGVYYTQWKYAGLSFAIIEDRKFKSAPKNVLPKEAQIWNGWVTNKNFDIKRHKDIDAQLLGERQHQFLDHWSKDWSNGIEMKVLLSQTNFATVATLPKEAISDEIVPSLAVPEKGEYIIGDVPTADMDSNGWPQNKRDKAIEIIRKCFAFHIAGDQHLASMVKYGVDEHGDSGYAFAGPALNNIWPRRWWPPIENKVHTLENPAYTGNFEDGFGNKITVLATGSPFKTNKEPSIVHDRATGYGLVTLNKKERTIKTDCWPRYVDPIANQLDQFNGWPITIKQEDNYGREAYAWLPELHIEGTSKPYVEIYKEGDLIYCLRLNKNHFKPKVFEKGAYTIVVSDPDNGKQSKMHNIKARLKNHKKIQIKL